MAESAISESKPWRSKSLGCVPRQAEEFNENLKRHGIQNAYYDKRTGDLVAHSNKAREALIRLSNAIDKDAYCR